MDILDKEKQLIEENKSEQPTGTLTTTFNKLVGEANTYVRSGYGPQKFF